MPLQAMGDLCKNKYQYLFKALGNSKTLYESLALIVTRTKNTVFFPISRAGPFLQKVYKTVKPQKKPTVGL